jgi:hypothetical protein
MYPRGIDQCRGAVLSSSSSLGPSGVST